MKRLFLFFITVTVTIIVLCFEASALDASDVSARNAALMCVQTGELLFEKNAYEKRSMASTTKIMTSLLAIEEYTPGREIKVTSSMLNVEGTSMGLLPGDTVTLEGLVYGMLLSSGNDAANVTAVTLGGSCENFALMMNHRAKEIGMKNTNFVTPSGLDDENHYSTAYDMALLGCEAVKNAEFLSICSQKSAVVYYGNPPYRRTLTNHNRLLSSYDGATGIKTGFTKKSGRCLVSCAQRDGVILVAVTLNAPDDWQDHRRMLDYGFSSVKSSDGVYNTEFQRVPVVGGTADSVSVSCGEVRLVGETDGIKTEFLAEHFLYAPVKKNQVIGYVNWLRDGKVIASSPVVTDENIPARRIENSDKKQSLFEKIKDYFKEKYQ